MKLYTEEQMRVVYNLGFSDSNNNFGRKEDETINFFTPIELPSDDDMANASNHCKDGQVKIGFLRGVLWYQEQILGKEDKTFKQKSKWTEVDNMTRRLK